MADILLNAVKGTTVEEVQHIFENDAVQHQVLGNAVLESLSEMKGLSDKCRSKSWLASIPSPLFLPLYILHYLDAVCLSENLHLLLFSNRVNFSTQKSLVYCKDLFLMAARENSAAIIAAGLLLSLQAWDLLLSFSELP